MGGHHSFRRLSERIDADPERRRRVEKLGKAYAVLLELVDSGGSNEEVARILEHWSRDSTAEELLELESGLRRIMDSAHEVPDNPDEVGEDLAWVLDLENLLTVWADYRELEERSVPAGELERRLGVSRERLEHSRGAGELVGVRIPYKQSYHYPEWQFDPASGEPLPGLAELSTTAADVGMDAMSLDGFMTNPAAGEGTPPGAVYRRGLEGRRTVLDWLGAARSGGS